MQIYLYLVGKRVSKILTNDEFKQGMRSAQIIDLREADSFKNGRIMGARNIPYSQLSILKSGIRKDMPIYLYENGRTLATRAAIQLHKSGFKDIYVLKTGFTNWDGKIKKNKY
ncbi:hypothetical protein FC40_GL000582 [Ligilactobacillus hayakitensis DSM 18933 = JCM 14209]|uniref:Rhodanese domain-containing protein n=2 Tax=Ligilactobacillus TaxID=2767887 RepID=A0A0R1WMV9_9LACO|nr:hypothetical protein FC40_GL000582 [Ligilactobacillus hayakitensis DSM 18933 = JCM 14209]